MNKAENNKQFLKLAFNQGAEEIKQLSQNLFLSSNKKEGLPQIDQVSLIISYVSELLKSPKERKIILKNNQETSNTTSPIESTTDSLREKLAEVLSESLDQELSSILERDFLNRKEFMLSPLLEVIECLQKTSINSLQRNQKSTQNNQQQNTEKDSSKIAFSPSNSMESNVASIFQEGTLVNLQRIYIEKDKADILLTVKNFFTKAFIPLDSFIDILNICLETFKIKKKDLAKTLETNPATISFLTTKARKINENYKEKLTRGIILVIDNKLEELN